MSTDSGSGGSPNISLIKVLVGIWLSGSDSDCLLAKKACGQGDRAGGYEAPNAAGTVRRYAECQAPSRWHILSIVFSGTNHHLLPKLPPNICWIIRCSTDFSAFCLRFRVWQLLRMFWQFVVIACTVTIFTTTCLRLSSTICSPIVLETLVVVWRKMHQVNNFETIKIKNYRTFSYA